MSSAFWETNDRIIKALGLGDQPIRRLDLHLRPDQLPLVEIEVELDSLDEGGEDIATELRRYELVEVPESGE